MIRTSGCPVLRCVSERRGFCRYRLHENQMTHLLTCSRTRPKTAIVENVLAPSCKIEVCPKRCETRLRWALLIQKKKTRSRAIEKPCAYWPSKSPMRIQKPFRMISLRKIRQQLPWIDILTKNTGGWGYIPTYRAWSESSRPSFTDSTSTGAGCTCSPCNKMLGHSAFLHKQLDVTPEVDAHRFSARARRRRSRQTCR